MTIITHVFHIWQQNIVIKNSILNEDLSENKWKESITGINDRKS